MAQSNADVSAVWKAMKVPPYLGFSGDVVPVAARVEDVVRLWLQDDTSRTRHTITASSNHGPFLNLFTLLSFCANTNFCFGRFVHLPTESCALFQAPYGVGRRRTRPLSRGSRPDHALQQKHCKKEERREQDQADEYTPLSCLYPNRFAAKSISNSGKSQDTCVHHIA